MFLRILCSGLFTLVFSCLWAQEKYALSGIVRDSASGEDMIGATVFIKEANVGAGTNSYGFYSFTLPRGTYTIVVNYVGFETYSRTVELNSNLKLDINIKEQKIETKEVVVTSDRPDANVKSMEMGTTKLEMKTISGIPPLLGEVDVIRSIQLLPGVSSVGEGATGFNVRGGSIDQNLVLLDEAPVYNTAHLFGFFSVFNPDAVKDVKLSKAAIPAQYGGRLSSVLDVRMKEGNMKKMAVQGGIGTIFSRLTVEGPIKKDKASFIIAGRRSYIDALAQPFLSGDLKGSKLYFYDLTAKANWIVNPRNRLFLSGYLGRDVFGFTGATFSWGNKTATLRWNHIFSDKLFLNLTSYYSNYDFKLAFGNDDQDNFKWTAHIVNYSARPEFTWYLNNKNKVTFGGQAIYYVFQPSNGVGVSRGKSTDISLPYQYAMENSLFAANEQKVLPWLSLQYGLRLSFFNYLGPGTAKTYSDTIGNFPRYPTSEKAYSDWETIKAYFNPEPRIAVNIALNEKSSVKVSYNRMAQYVHLISNTVASIPIDIWQPSTNNIKPQLSNQYSMGYFRNFGTEHGIEASVEVFYKDMFNQLDYVDGADIRFNPNLEGVIVPGTGRSFGAEFYVKKSAGRLTGWVSYTLSKSERKIPGINHSDWYPSRFDRRHNLSVVAMYQLSPRWNIAGTFTFGSGTPFNFPIDKFQLEGYTAFNNPDAPRNNLRLPAYNRLDLSATLKSKEKERHSKVFKNYSWELVFSVYNVYNRRNAFAILPQTNSQDPFITSAMKVSIIGSIIPGITYNFKF
jgi:hypothetical protein